MELLSDVGGPVRLAELPGLEKPQDVFVHEAPAEARLAQCWASSCPGTGLSVPQAGLNNLRERPLL